jgi:hypothetical protein
MNNPTTEIYEFLTHVFNAINEACFQNELPEVLLTVKGKSNVFGYYKHNAYVSHSGQIVDEIAVNPRYFATHGFQELIMTLSHECVHAWQQHYGKPSVRSYHNREFAEKMKSIGLMPSSTGKEGGKETGQNMAEYIIEGGLIIQLYHRLEKKGVYIPWYERLRVAGEVELDERAPENVVSESTSESSSGSNTTRSRYTHQCINDKKPSVIYGKPSLSILCGICESAWEES